MRRRALGAYTRRYEHHIRAHHTSVFDDFTQHAEKRLGRIERYLPRVGEVVVEVEHEETKSAADWYAVQVTLHSGGLILRAEERGADPRAALDAASMCSRARLGGTRSGCTTAINTCTVGRKRRRR